MSRMSGDCGIAMYTQQPEPERAESDPAVHLNDHRMFSAVLHLCTTGTAGDHGRATQLKVIFDFSTTIFKVAVTSS